MKCHEKFLNILMLAILLSSCFPSSDRISGDGNRPNILFIAVDDLKPTIGCYDDPMAITPNMDRIAAGGITFMHNYCQQAVCAPSRASLLTGRYPDQLRVWDLQTLIREKNPGIITLPQYFRNSGYLTAATGKIFDPRSLEGSWNGPHDSLSWSIGYIPAGNLNTYNTATGPPDYFYAGKDTRQKIQALQAEASKQGLETPGEVRNFVQQRLFPAVECVDVPFDAYHDGAIAKHGISLMDSLAGSGKPFFLAVGFNRPHLPFTAPKKYWDLYGRNRFNEAQFQDAARDSPEIAYHNSGELRNGYTGIPLEGRLPDSLQLELIHGYYAAVSYIDDMIGMLLKKLDDLKLTDQTIILIWGDHGWHLGDHGLWCKHSNFEQATRAPLILSDPRSKIKDRRYQAPTEFTDVAPTLCELTGIPVPDYFEGISLKPLFADPGQVLRTSSLSQYPRNGMKVMGYSIRTERYRYTKWIERDGGKVIARELYDYLTDPQETESRIAHPSYEGETARLDSILSARIKDPSTR